MSEIFKYHGDIEWSLPLMFQYEPVFAKMADAFYKFGLTLPPCNLYGSPANIWAGGRVPAIHEKFTSEMLTKIFEYVKSFGATPTYTFTCSQVEKEDLNDKYANMLLDIGAEYGARFIVFSDMLKDYIKNKYPSAICVASVVKPALRFQGATKEEEPTVENETNYYNKLLKEYDVVVVRPEYSMDVLVDFPDYLDDISRVEVLINQACAYNCPKMPDHYRAFEMQRINTNMRINFECIQKNRPAIRNFKENVLHTKEMTQKLIDNGVRHLKLQGRGVGSSAAYIASCMLYQMINGDGKAYFIYSQVDDKSLDKQYKKFREYIGDVACEVQNV